MTFSFTCHSCENKYFFKDCEEIEGSLICIPCYEIYLMTEQLREDSKNAHREKKEERRIENDQKANERLKREIEEERIKLQNQSRTHIVTKVPDEDDNWSQKFEFKEHEKEIEPIMRTKKEQVVRKVVKKKVIKKKPTPKVTKKAIIKPKVAKPVPKITRKKVMKKQISKPESTIPEQDLISESVQFHRSRKLTPEIEAAELGEIFDTLYVYADVKRIKVFEWKDGKKRVALNKERELRRTHAGGFSQEKFQRFIDMKKKKSWEWIEDNLTRQGILSPPFEKVVIDCNDEVLKEKITNKIAQLE